MEPCCQQPENRSQPERLPNGATVQKCTVCGRRHFEVVVDPGRLGVEIKP